MPFSERPCRAALTNAMAAASEAMEFARILRALLGYTISPEQEAAVDRLAAALRRTRHYHQQMEADLVADSRQERHIP